MGSLEKNRRRGQQLIWFLVGFLFVQGALTLDIERFWPSVRDPEFYERMIALRAHRQAAPHTPLIVMLGSSHTAMGVDAAQLSKPTEPNDASAPLVFNLGMPGGGAMMEEVCLERLLAEGLRPDHLFIEIVPTGLSERKDRPAEEQSLDPTRLGWGEMVRLVRTYYERPDIAWPRCLLARALPIYRFQAELRTPLAVDKYRDGDSKQKAHCDDYGYIACEEVKNPREQAAQNEFALGQYKEKVVNFRLSPGADHAVHDLLDRCRREQIPTTLVLMPEASVFRALYAPETRAFIDTYVHDLTARYDVPLIDARMWVADDGFWDAHHMNTRGATAFTERFGREVLHPLLAHAAPRPPADSLH